MAKTMIISFTGLKRRFTPQNIQLLALSSRISSYEFISTYNVKTKKQKKKQKDGHFCNFSNPGCWAVHYRDNNVTLAEASPNASPYHPVQNDTNWCKRNDLSVTRIIISVWDVSDYIVWAYITQLISVESLY